MDWNRVKEHVEDVYPKVVQAVNGFCEITRYVGRVDELDYPPRLEILMGVATTDGRRREVFGTSIGTVAEKVTDDERVAVAQFMTKLAQDHGWRCWRETQHESAWNMRYTLKPNYKRTGGDLNG
jgi:hypothetical protein